MYSPLDFDSNDYWSSIAAAFRNEIAQNHSGWKEALETSQSNAPAQAGSKNSSA